MAAGGLGLGRRVTAGSGISRYYSMGSREVNPVKCGRALGCHGQAATTLRFARAIPRIRSRPATEASRHRDVHGQTPTPSEPAHGTQLGYTYPGHPPTSRTLSLPMVPNSVLPVPAARRLVKAIHLIFQDCMAHTTSTDYHPRSTHLLRVALDDQREVSRLHRLICHTIGSGNCLV